MTDNINIDLDQRVLIENLKDKKPLVEWEEFI